MDFEDFTGNVTGDAGQQGNDSGNGGNPAWTNALNDIPQEFHEKLTPHFQEWDRSVNKRFETVQQQYAPWKPIMQAAGDNPEIARYALQLAEAIQSDPKQVWEAIGSKYQFSQAVNGQGQEPPTQQQQLDPWEEKYSKLENEFQQFRQQHGQVAEYLVNQRRQQMEAQEDAQLQSELAELKKKSPEMNEQFVLQTLATNPGMTTQQAFDQWQQFDNQMRVKYGARPIITAGGGNMPSDNFNPAKASQTQVNSQVAEILRAAAEERRR